ncbi:MAG: VOC family protein, partial [bacterium]|nr:VOC family protein [bacterium]
ARTERRAGHEPDTHRRRNPDSAVNSRENPLELPVSATPPAFFRSLLGGELQMPVIDIEVGGELVGRMTVLADPEGARISLWQPGRHAGAAIANEPGTFAWNELMTRDVDGARRFYGQLFGWDVAPIDGAENGYQEIRVGGRSNGGMLPWHAEIGEMPAAWSVYFAVRDCDEAVLKIRELGGNQIVPPTEVGAGRFAVVADPQGAVFNVMAMNTAD